jgi:hypothetical protein
MKKRNEKYIKQAHLQEMRLERMTAQIAGIRLLQ